MIPSGVGAAGRWRWIASGAWLRLSSAVTRVAHTSVPAIRSSTARTSVLACSSGIAPASTRDKSHNRGHYQRIAAAEPSSVPLSRRSTAQSVPGSAQDDRGRRYPNVKGFSALGAERRGRGSTARVSFGARWSRRVNDNDLICTAIVPVQRDRTRGIVQCSSGVQTWPDHVSVVGLTFEQDNALHAPSSTLLCVSTGDRVVSAELSRGSSTRHSSPPARHIAPPPRTLPANPPHRLRGMR